MEIAPPRPSLLLHIRLLRLGLRRLVLNLDQSTALAVQRLQQRMAAFSSSSPSSSSSSSRLYAYLPHPAGQATVGPSSVSRLHTFPLAAASAAAGVKETAARTEAPQQQQQQRQRQRQGRRKLFIERLRLETLAINLSLSRPRESPDEVGWMKDRWGWRAWMRCDAGAP